MGLGGLPPSFKLTLLQDKSPGVLSRWAVSGVYRGSSRHISEYSHKHGEIEEMICAMSATNDMMLISRFIKNLLNFDKILASNNLIR